MIRVLLTSVVLATLFLAYSNGANDNFKGVATLYGSNAVSFRTALWIGTTATLAGCISSIFLAEALIEAFSGSGLVPDAVSQSPAYRLAVAVGAASTVMLATILGFPISTTHALTGALVGAGVVAVGPQLDLSVFGRAFFLPLLVSPILSVFLAMSLYKFAHESRRRLGIEKETCVCVGPSQYVPLAQLAYDNGTRAFVRPVPSDGGFAVTVGTERDCVEVYRGHFASVTAQSTVNAVHCVSAIAVSFARGLNDLPKIVGVLLVAKVLDLHVGMIAIALAMALGGLINARNVAETMSKKISGMNDGQALTANIVTAVMVICASRFGMPVSTTHVSVGAISGVGLVKGTADRSVIVNILLSWVLTLPVAAAIAAAISAALAMVS